MTNSATFTTAETRTSRDHHDLGKVGTTDPITPGGERSLARSTQPIGHRSEWSPEQRDLITAAAAVAMLLPYLGSGNAVLFGSRARRDHRPTSDFDILAMPGGRSTWPTDLQDEIQLVERATLAAQVFAPKAKIHLEMVRTEAIEDLITELPFLAPALADAVELTGIARGLLAHLPSPVHH